MSFIEIHRKNCEIVSEEVTVGDVAHMLASSEARVLCVTRGIQIVGYISDKEMAERASALGREFRRLQAKHVMVGPPITIDWKPRAIDIRNTVTLMRRVRASTAVVTRETTPIGVVSVDMLQVHYTVGA